MDVISLLQHIYELCKYEEAQDVGLDINVNFWKLSNTHVKLEYFLVNRCALLLPFFTFIRLGQDKVFSSFST